jgi:hypothetical protein
VLRDLKSIDLGHHDVEDHQVGVQLADLQQRLLAVAGDRDVVTGIAQVQLDESRDVRIVVDDQDRLGHSTSIALGSGLPRVSS